MRNHQRKELLEDLHRILDGWDDTRFVLRQLRALRALNEHDDLLQKKADYLRLYGHYRRVRKATGAPESASDAYRRFKRAHQFSCEDVETDIFRRNISKIIYWIHSGQLSRAKHGIRIVIRHNLRRPDPLLYKVCEKLWGFDGAMVVRKYHPDVMLWLKSN